MSLDPHWFSTIFGVYYFAGGVVGFFALLPIAAVRRCSGRAAWRRGDHRRALPRPGQAAVRLHRLLGLHRLLAVHADLVRQHPRGDRLVPPAADRRLDLGQPRAAVRPLRAAVPGADLALAQAPAGAAGRGRGVAARPCTGSTCTGWSCPEFAPRRGPLRPARPALLPRPGRALRRRAVLAPRGVAPWSRRATRGSPSPWPSRTREREPDRCATTIPTSPPARSSVMRRRDRAVRDHRRCSQALFYQHGARRARAARSSSEPLRGAAPGSTPSSGRSSTRYRWVDQQAGVVAHPDRAGDGAGRRRNLDASRRPVKRCETRRRGVIQCRDCGASRLSSSRWPCGGVTRPRAAQVATEPLPDALEDVGIDGAPRRPAPARPRVHRRGRTHGRRSATTSTGDRPVILTLVYYRCPMLCGLRAQRARGRSAGARLDAGRASSRSSRSASTRSRRPTLAKLKKQNYLKQLRRPGGRRRLALPDRRAKRRSAGSPRPSASATATTDETRRVRPRRGDSSWLTPDGRVSRYLYGIEYPTRRPCGSPWSRRPRATIGSPIDQLLLFCFHYDAERGTLRPGRDEHHAPRRGVTLLVLGTSWSLWSGTSPLTARLTPRSGSSAGDTAWSTARADAIDARRREVRAAPPRAVGA